MTLCPLTENDLEAAPWLDQALLDPDGDSVAISRDRSLVGVLGCGVGAPQDGWLSFRFVAVEPRLRGLGLDSEAVRMVEEDALGRGLAHCFWTDVRQSDGLAFYFWLRLGYRPARPDEGLWPGERPRDIIAMIRAFEDTEPRA